MKRILYITVLLLIAAGVLTGCGASEKEEEKEKAKYYLYYINGEETELQKEKYTPKEESPQAMLTELMHLLKEEGAQENRQPLLPKGVELTTHTINESTLTLDFSKGYSKMSPSREVLTRAGIVCLFAQLPDIEYVKFTVEGEELEDSQGMPISIMNADTFVEYSGEAINSYQYATITLYFTNKEGNKLLQEERTVYYNSNVPLERVIVEQLMKGPAQDGMHPTLPANMNVMGVTKDNEGCYLNLDAAFLSESLPVQPEIPIYSIVNSIVDACPLKNVQISVNGESNMVFRESIELNQFFRKNEELIQKQE